jgi:hypothetical protein
MLVSARPDKRTLSLFLHESLYDMYEPYSEMHIDLFHVHKCVDAAVTLYGSLAFLREMDDLLCKLEYGILASVCSTQTRSNSTH